MNHLAEAGRIRPDGGPGLWAVSCGGCRTVKTLPRGLSREGAATTARREGHSYFQPFGWLCPSCRFGFGVAPEPTPPRPSRGVQAAPWRRVELNLYNVLDPSGLRVIGRLGELLSCGHIFVPRDGSPSGNRRRRCLDCRNVGAGSMR